jgi:hypothetical protein
MVRLYFPYLSKERGKEGERGLLRSVGSSGEIGTGQLIKTLQIAVHDT